MMEAMEGKHLRVLLFLKLQIAAYTLSSHRGRPMSLVKIATQGSSGSSVFFLITLDVGEKVVSYSDQGFS